MAITKESVTMAVETVKDFFKDILRPNMELEDIKQITFPRFHKLIKSYEKKGYDYGGGKFYVKCIDDEHFQLAFEMYFRDEEERWHKVDNESELRDITLLEDSLIKTMKSLKVVEFAIDAPNAEKSEKKPAQLTPPPVVLEKIEIDSKVTDK